MTSARMFNGSIARSILKTVGKITLFVFPKAREKQDKKYHGKLLVLAA